MPGLFTNHENLIFLGSGEVVDEGANREKQESTEKWKRRANHHGCQCNHAVTGVQPSPTGLRPTQGVITERSQRSSVTCALWFHPVLIDNIALTSSTYRERQVKQVCNQLMTAGSARTPQFYTPSPWCPVKLRLNLVVFHEHGCNCCR